MSAAFMALLGGSDSEDMGVRAVSALVAFFLSFGLPRPRLFQLSAAHRRRIYYRRLLAAFVAFGPPLAQLPLRLAYFANGPHYLPTLWLLAMALTGLPVGWLVGWLGL